MQKNSQLKVRVSLYLNQLQHALPFSNITGHFQQLEARVAGAVEELLEISLVFHSQAILSLSILPLPAPWAKFAAYYDTMTQSLNLADVPQIPG